MDIIIKALSITGLICMIASSLIKGERMKLILFLVCLGNATVSAGYLLTGYFIDNGASYAGGIACGIGAVTTLINAVIQAKGKKIPKWLVGAYAVIYAVPQLWVYFGNTAVWQTLIALVASVSFTLCINAENGRFYRIFTIVNMILWCSYDALVPNWDVLLFTHLPLLVFTFVGMLIHDRKKA